MTPPLGQTVALFTDTRMRAHDPGSHHPESPRRLAAIIERLQSLNDDRIEWRDVTPATREQLLRVHTADHVDAMDACRGRSLALDADTIVSPHSIDAAYLAAGAAVGAVECVMRGETTAAWALVRPPGHHAEADRAMGFCVFNNVAVAAAHAIAELGCRRVLIVDWDVHHGNGTQHIFESRADVLFFSVHRGGNFYPATGRENERGIGEGEGFTINVPLPPHSGDDVYARVFEQNLLPRAKDFAPELVLVSAGFDAHQCDPLGGMRVTTNGFSHICQMVRSIADSTCDGRIALVLEGGYDVTALADCTEACCRELLSP